MKNAALWLALVLGATDPALVPVPRPDLRSMQKPIREAIETVRKIVDDLDARTDDPEQLGEAYGRLGEVYQAHALPGAAEAAYRNALALRPEDARRLYYFALLLAETGRPAEAAERLRAVLAREPENLPALVRLGHAELEQGRNEAARDAFERASKLDPRAAAAHDGLGRAAFAAGDALVAAGHFERALELAPEADVVRYRLGQALRRLGRLEEAKTQLARSGQREIRLRDPLLEQMAQIVAISALQAVLELVRAEDFSPRDVLGFALTQLGTLEGALDYLERTLVSWQSGPEARPARARGRLHFVVGGLWDERGDQKRAEEHLKGALALAPELGPQLAAARPRAAQPSFLLVTLDTTRADHLEPYGARGAETPALAALAGEGALFERAYAVAPVTLPTHASLFTGQDPPAHGVRNNGIHALPPTATTLAELLRDAGFRTGAFVSAAVLDRRYGLDQGFEHYDDDLAGGNPKAPREVAERPAEATVAAARTWLDALPATERFFLWVHLFDPHAAYAPPPLWAERFRDRPYDGEIAYADAQLARLLEHPRLGRFETMVMVVGDHGESLGEHGEASHAMLAYDATLRIPWLVRLPQGPRGLRLQAPVSQVDLLPTALDLLGLGKPGTAQTGVSLAARLRGTEAEGAAAWERALYAETLVPFYTYGWAPLHALRRGHFKLIEAQTPELFDLEHDPGELADLSTARPAETRALRRELRELVGAAEPPAATDLDPETAARLRSLGYLSASGARAARRSRPDPKTMIEVHRAVERAEQRLWAREFEAAAREFEAVLEKDPENLAALGDLAKAQAELSRLEPARETLGRALALDPQNAALHLTLGLVERAAGRLEPALEAFERALALDPRLFEAEVEAARTLAWLGRGSEAAAHLETLRAKEAGEARVEIAYAELVDLPARRLDAAEQRVRRALQREPFHLEGRRVLAQVHEARAAEAVAKGDWAAAERAARRALELDKDFAGAWNHLAVALEETARAQEALAAYQKATQADPAYWQASFNQGLLLRKLGRWTEAVVAFEKVLTRQPSHAKSHYELGVLYGGALSDPQKARRHLEACLAAEPDHPRAIEVRRLLAVLPEP